MALSERIRKAIEKRRAEQPTLVKQDMVVDHQLPARPLPRPNPFTDMLAIGFAEDAVLFAVLVDAEYRGEAMRRITADDFSTIWRRQVWDGVMRLVRERREVTTANLYPLVEPVSFNAMLRAFEEVKNPYTEDYLTLVEQQAQIRRAVQAALGG